MKKSLLALAVAGVALTSVASAATVYDKDGTTLSVYGRIQGVVYSSHVNATNDSGDDGLKATGRLGFDMRSQLTSNLAAIAKLEYDVADAYDNFRARYAWVGLDMGQFGILKGGRFEDAVYTGVTSTTDIFDDWGCNGLTGNDDKRDGIIGYYWNGYGFDVQATVQMAHDNQHQDDALITDHKVVNVDDNTTVINGNPETLNVDSAYSIAVGYTSPVVVFGPIAVKAGYGYTSYQDDAMNTSYGSYDYTNTTAKIKYGIIGQYDSKSQWAAALSWGSLDQGLYLAAVYNYTKYDITNGKLTVEQPTPATVNFDNYKVQGYEAVVAYGFANGVSVRTGYEYKQFKAMGNKAAAQVIPAYVNYQVNPNFNVWVEGRFDVGTDDGAVKNFNSISGGLYDYNQNVYSVGARYTF